VAGKRLVLCRRRLVRLAASRKYVADQTHLDSLSTCHMQRDREERAEAQTGDCWPAVRGLESGMLPQGTRLEPLASGPTSLIPETSASSPKTQTPGALVASVTKLAAAAPLTFLARRRKGRSLGGVWYEGPEADGLAEVDAGDPSEPDVAMRMVDAKSSVCMAAAMMLSSGDDRRPKSRQSPTIDSRWSRSLFHSTISPLQQCPSYPGAPPLWVPNGNCPVASSSLFLAHDRGVSDPFPLDLSPSLRS
jgi:hypothetical protein